MRNEKQYVIIIDADLVSEAKENADHMSGSLWFIDYTIGVDDLNFLIKERALNEMGWGDVDVNDVSAVEVEFLYDFVNRYNNDEIDTVNTFIAVVTISI